jgi:putative transposase
VRFKASAHLAEDGTKPMNSIIVKNSAAIFRHKDPVDVHLENTVSSVSNIIVVCHRPSVIKVMQRLQSYKYELKTNGEQQRNMRRFAGSCRFVFNKALAMQKALYEQGEKKLGYAGFYGLAQLRRHGLACGCPGAPAATDPQRLGTSLH